MSVTRYGREHNGVDFAGVEDRQRTVVGSITMGNKKWTLTGFPKIQTMKGSYKHGDEIQIAIWNKLGTTFEKDRVRFEPNGDPKVHKWDTVEVFFKADVWHDLIREYIKFYKEVN